MTKYCIKCGKQIPEGRVKAIHSVKTCVQCSNTEKVAGFRVIQGKTEYSQLQIVSQDTYQRLTKAQSRKGQSPGAGVRMGGH